MKLWEKFTALDKKWKIAIVVGVFVLAAMIFGS